MDSSTAYSNHMSGTMAEAYSPPSTCGDSELTKAKDRVGTLKAISRASTLLPQVEQALRSLPTRAGDPVSLSDRNEDLAGLTSLKLHGSLDTDTVIQRLQLLAACMSSAQQFADFEKDLGQEAKEQQVMRSFASGDNMSIQRIGKNLGQFVKRQSHFDDAITEKTLDAAVRLGTKLRILNALGKSLGLGQSGLSLILGFDCAYLNRMTYSSLRYVTSELLSDQQSYGSFTDFSRNFDHFWSSYLERYHRHNVSSDQDESTQDTEPFNQNEMDWSTAMLPRTTATPINAARRPDPDLSAPLWISDNSTSMIPGVIPELNDTINTSYDRHCSMSSMIQVHPLHYSEQSSLGLQNDTITEDSDTSSSLPPSEYPVTATNDAMDFLHELDTSTSATNFPTKAAHDILRQSSDGTLYRRNNSTNPPIGHHITSKRIPTSIQRTQRRKSSRCNRRRISSQVTHGSNGIPNTFSNSTTLALEKLLQETIPSPGSLDSGVHLETSSAMDTQGLSAAILPWSPPTCGGESAIHPTLTNHAPTHDPHDLLFSAFIDGVARDIEGSGAV